MTYNNFPTVSRILPLVAAISLLMSIFPLHAAESESTQTTRRKQITAIASATAKSDFPALREALDSALDSGMTVNEAKEVIVHTYAYCGFPKALRGQQTFVDLLDRRIAADRPVIYTGEQLPPSKTTEANMSVDAPYFQRSQGFRPTLPNLRMQSSLRKSKCF